MQVLETLLIATLLLGFLVFIHEGGHFLVARAFKVRVTEFMIGFPGPHIGFTRKGTKFGITAIPLGGYAKVCGMLPAPNNPIFKDILGFVYDRGEVTYEEVAKVFSLEIKEAFDLLEVLVDWGSLEHPTQKRTDNTYRTPARKGLPAGTAYEVNDLEAFYKEEESQQYCSISFWKRACILAAGPIMNLLYAMLMFVIIYSILGIDLQNTATGEVKHIVLNPIDSIVAGFRYISTVVVAILGLFNPATAAETVSNSTSIIGIAVLSRDAFEAGLVNILSFSAIISVSLGLMNLLPIPPLDGGRLLIEIIQKIARRPVPVRVQNYLSTAGFVLFMVFFIVMVNQDIQRFIFGNWG